MRIWVCVHEGNHMCVCAVCACVREYVCVCVIAIVFTIQVSGFQFKELTYEPIKLMDSN